jgi:hypothetical protein
MERTCRQRCVDYLKRHQNEWIASGEMQRLAVQHSTFTGSTVARELRRIAEEGEVEVKLINNHAHYRYVDKEPQRLKAIAWFDALPD